jgi:hypothetical protein
MFQKEEARFRGVKPGFRRLFSMVARWMSHLPRCLTSLHWASGSIKKKPGGVTQPGFEQMKKHQTRNDRGSLFFGEIVCRNGEMNIASVTIAGASIDSSVRLRATALPKRIVAVPCSS